MPILPAEDIARKEKLQDVPSSVTVINMEDITKKGVWNFSLNQLADLRAGTNKVDGEEYSKYLNIRGRVEANYYLVDHFAVGAGINFSGKKTIYSDLIPETIQRQNALGGHVNLIYGTPIADVVNIITKASVGYGKQTTKLEGYYGESEYSDNYINLNATVGFPLRVNRNVYFTPFAGYGFKRTTGEGYSENRSGFIAGFSMDYYMGCGDKFCDFGDNEFSLDDRYRQGDILLGSRMKGLMRMGTLTQQEDDVDEKYRDGFNTSHLGGYGLYYPIDNLGVGAGISFGYNRISSKETDFKSAQTDLLFYPIVRYNLPFDNHLKDIFVEGSFGVGFTNYRTDISGNINKVKSTVTAWEAGLGYNYFIAESFSMGPMVGFQGQTTKNKDDDTKNGFSGFTAGIAWNYHIH